MFKRIRTRYAPSPTGFLHLGGLRTALFSYLFAKHYNGDFILRFEDTDIKRNVDGAYEQILQTFKLLDLKIDETTINPGKFGPYKQSEKLGTYFKKAIELVKQKKAYYCFCTMEELNIERKKQINLGYKAIQYSKKCLKLSIDEIKKNLKLKKEFTIRFNVIENQEIKFKDMVFGNVSFNTKHIEDFVIIKTNKFPTYNFAVVIDDYDMKISHILRGSDHLSNTPKQILIFKAFNWQIPEFAHLTLINNLSSTKMSKRKFDEKQYLNYYLKLGFIPKALCNYLALLGWCPELTQEIFSLEELIKRFDGSKLNKGNSTFSFVKLTWINRKQIQKLTDEEFWNFSKPFLNEFEKKPKIKEIILLFKNEISFFSQIKDYIQQFYVNEIVYNNEQKKILIENKEIIILFKNELLNIEKLKKEKISNIFFKIKGKVNLSNKKMMNLLRILITGKSKGPKLNYLIFYLGKEKILNFINNVIKN